MSHKKLFLLTVLLFSHLFMASFAGHTCNHDNQESPEPVVQEIEEDWNPEGNDHSGRTLASYNNIKIYPYYGGLDDVSASLKNYISVQMFPPIVDWLQAALKVKYPVSGLWKTTASSTCGMDTPAILKSGVNADFVLFIITDTSANYIANTYTCNRASGTNRPLAGRTTISTKFINPTTDPISHENNVLTMLHEIVHALGFSTWMYPFFIGSTGKQLSGHVTYETYDDGTALVLNVEPLTTKLRAHFGCATLKGAYMENSGGSATMGSHFERRVFTQEFMISATYNQQQISIFTLALLEGSGWYVADYSLADGFWWGQGEGCDFVTGECSANDFTEYCDQSTRGCANPGRGGGSCSSDARSDGCKTIIPSGGYDCDNGNAKNNARLPSAEVYGRGLNSKCFTGTLANSKSAGSSTTFCFKPTCSGTGSKTTVTIQVGSQSVVCTAEGKKTVSGYAGQIDCPDPVTFCQTVGAPICPRGCYGRGPCVNGICQCEAGFKGVDCSFTA